MMTTCFYHEHFFHPQLEQQLQTVLVGRTTTWPRKQSLFLASQCRGDCNPAELETRRSFGLVSQNLTFSNPSTDMGVPLFPVFQYMAMITITMMSIL